MSTSSKVQRSDESAGKAASERDKPRGMLGELWEIPGILLFIVGAVTYLVNRNATSGYFVGWGIGFLAWMCMLGGIGLFNHGRKYSAPSARQVFAQDKRKPVVYLRSFKDDGLTSQVHDVFEWETEEEQIARVMNGIGPFIAIGDPHEKLPKLGAARTYVGNQEWQRTISILGSHAQLVVLRAGDTPGLWWEVERVSKCIRPERLLFLIPYDKKEYDAFCRKADSYFPKPLPEYVPAKGLFFGFGAVKGLVYFERDWTPHFLPLKNAGMRGLAAAETPLSNSLRIALQPVLEQLQIPFSQVATPFPKRVGRLLLFAVLAFGTICLAFFISMKFGW